MTRFANPSDQPMNQPLSNPITEDDIAHYLSNTPDFFQRHSELLAAVQFTSPHSKRAVSLQERQAEMLREKIKVLEQRVMEMIRNGNENVMLSDKILRWARTLFLANDLAGMPEQIVEEIRGQFSVPQVGIRVWGVATEYADLPFASGVSEDAVVFASSLTEPFCGLNTGFEAASWLPEAHTVTSLALIPLRSGTAAAAWPRPLACWCWPRPTPTASTAAWAPTFWPALAIWPARRCRG